jgi:hypothetical protein
MSPHVTTFQPNFVSSVILSPFIYAKFLKAILDIISTINTLVFNCK